MTMTDYVLGFLFNRYGQVLLIKKERPDWQRGKMNGIGGKIEPGETPYDAMCREFREEAGIDVMGWDLRGYCTGENFVVHVFRADFEGGSEPRTVTDEEVEWRYIANLGDSDILPHVEAMVHCCKMSIGAKSEAPIFDFCYNG